MFRDLPEDFEIPGLPRVRTEICFPHFQLAFRQHIQFAAAAGLDMLNQGNQVFAECQTQDGRM